MTELLFIASMLWIAGDNFPAPSPNNAGVAGSQQPGRSVSIDRVASMPQIPQDIVPQTVPTFAQQCKTGWGTDPEDGKMYFVVQIPPAVLPAFAAGDRGQEMESLVPTPLRGRIEKVIVRIGNGEVEKNPSEAELSRMALLNPREPHIANLDRRGPVSIDSPRVGSEIVPTGGNNQLGSSLQGGPSTDNREVLPTDLNNPLSSTLDNRNLNNANWQGSQPNRSATASLQGDGFSPSRLGSNTTPAIPGAPSALNFLNNRNNNVNPSLGANGPNYGSTSTLAGGGYGSVNGATGMSPGTGSNATYGAPLVANNSMLNNNMGGTGTPNYAQPTFGAANDGLNHFTQPGGQSPFPYGANVPSQPHYTSAPQQNSYNNPNYNGNTPLYPTLSNIPQFASRPTPSTLAGSNEAYAPQQSTVAPRREVLVPFALIVSIIGNVYLGLWLNHLRVRYRGLLANMRGVNPIDLDHD